MFGRATIRLVIGPHSSFRHLSAISFTSERIFLTKRFEDVHQAYTCKSQAPEKANAVDCKLSI